MSLTTNTVSLHCFDTVSGDNGVGTNFGVGVEEARPEGLRARDGVLEEGTASPSPPTKGFAGALLAP